MSRADFIYRQLLTLSANGRTRRSLLVAVPTPAPATLGLSEDMLRLVAGQRLYGKSFSSIAAMLNKQGLRGRNGGRWYASNVREYLLRHFFGTLRD